MGCGRVCEAAELKMSSEYPKTITLPSGRTAKLTRKMKMRDAVFARRAVGPQDTDNNIAIGLAALAPTLELDGKPAVYEDLLELEVEDMAVLSESADLEKKTSLMAPRSPDSSSSGSAAAS
jgi:hypothetical protein